MIDEYENVEENKEEELKRADHLIYVTLKYTRTIDVMKNIIKRFISAIELSVSEALGRLKIKPAKVAQLRFKQLESKIPKIKEYYNFYLFLKKIDKTKCTGKEEYRKKVSLIAGDTVITVDNLKEYFDKTKEFVKLVS